MLEVDENANQNRIAPLSESHKVGIAVVNKAPRALINRADN
ncbi:MAG: hypothetical protein JWO15_2725 [Sphingomonadales bacterium]|nr:hypothetical protein [Sphingomonadales bacterium]